MSTSANAAESLARSVSQSVDDSQIWTKTAQLVLSGVRPGARYSLPFFAHRELENLLFVDGEKALRYCEDTDYKASDHNLLWLDYDGLDRPAAREKEECNVVIQLYYSLADGLSLPTSTSNPRLSIARQADVFPFVDYFDNGSRGIDEEEEDTSLKHWRVQGARQSLSSVTFGDRPDGTADAHLNHALCIDPAGGELLLTRKFPLATLPGRLQLRAYFYDADGEGAHHWLGFTAGKGAFALGLHPNVQGHYALYCTIDAEGGWGSSHSWQQVKAVRTPGWHVLEFVLQEKWLSILVDGQKMGGLPVPAPPGADDEICLGAAAGPRARWAGVEVLHTPFGDKRWEVGVQKVYSDSPRTWRPWSVKQLEDGRWAVNEHGTVQSLIPPAVAEDLDAPCPAADVAEGQERLDPAAGEKFPHSAEPSEILAIASETDAERMDRVMTHVLQQLRGAAAQFPDNIERLEAESDPRNKGCFLYSFGTRRLHITVREGDGKKLSLVVRSGGGYLDFAEFVNKNGTLEQAKQRFSDARNHDAASTTERGRISRTQSQAPTGRAPSRSGADRTSCSGAVDRIQSRGAVERNLSRGAADRNLSRGSIDRIPRGSSNTMERLPPKGGAMLRTPSRGGLRRPLLGSPVLRVLAP